MVQTGPSGPAPHFAVILHLLSNPHLRPRVVSTTFLAHFAALLKATWGTDQPAAHDAPLASQLQHALGALLNETVLREHGDAVLRHVIVAVCEVRPAPAHKGTQLPRRGGFVVAHKLFADANAAGLCP